MGKKTSTRAERERQRGEGIKRRCQKPSRAWLPDGRNNSRENAPAAQYPGPHLADSDSQAPGWGSPSLNLAAVQADGAAVCLHRAALAAGIQAYDMLNLILLAIFSSQNISHLFPGFLTMLRPGLFAQSG